MIGVYTMERSPNDTNRTLLLGPIDTAQEIKTILAILQKESHLRRVCTEMEINNFLETLKKWRLNHIEGSIDTPREIELFLDILRKSKMLVGPIDTPEEIKLFMQKLQQQGALQSSFATLRERPQWTPEEEPPRKKRKRRTDYEI
jgi:hypothetical protein